MGLITCTLCRLETERFDQFGHLLFGHLGAGLFAKCGTCPLDGGRVEQIVQSGSNVVRFESRGVQVVAGTDAFDPGGVVGLVVGEGHDELRDAGGEALGGGADAAVMEDGGGAREDAAERNVLEARPHRAAGP